MQSTGFQFLIGIINQVMSAYSPFACSEFQFLIGIINQNLVETTDAIVIWFQFLIGIINPIKNQKCGFRGGVSIPHRYYKS